MTCLFDDLGLQDAPAEIPRPSGFAARLPRPVQASLPPVELTVHRQPPRPPLPQRLGLWLSPEALESVLYREEVGRPFDLILFDIQMPGMDGIRATQLIRSADSMARQHDVPIIAMTANAMKGDREKYLAAGMNDYLSKPVIPKNLADILDRWLPIEKQPLGSGGERDDMSVDGELSGVFELSALIERLMGDKELAWRIVSIFIQDFPVQVDMLRAYLARSEWKDAERQAHSIKGAAANVGAERLRGIALAIERACGLEVRSTIDTLLAQIEWEFGRMADEANRRRG